MLKCSSWDCSCPSTGGWEPVPELLEAFRTEFALRLFWGQQGATAGRKERYEKFDKILHVLSDKLEPVEVVPQQADSWLWAVFRSDGSWQQHFLHWRKQKKKQAKNETKLLTEPLVFSKRDLMGSGRGKRNVFIYLNVSNLSLFARFCGQIITVKRSGGFFHRKSGTIELPQFTKCTFLITNQCSIIPNPSLYMSDFKAKAWFEWMDATVWTTIKTDFVKSMDAFYFNINGNVIIIL